MTHKASLERDELKKLARMSQLALTEQQVDEAVHVVGARLTYITMLQDIVAQQQSTTPLKEQTLHSVMREDVVKTTDPEPLLALAPQSEAHYFVVPVIIKQNS